MASKLTGMMSGARDFERFLNEARSIIVPLAPRIFKMAPHIMPTQLEINLAEWRRFFILPANVIMFARTALGYAIMIEINTTLDGDVDRSRSSILMASYESLYVWKLATNIDSWLTVMDNYGYNKLVNYHKEKLGQWFDQHRNDFFHKAAFMMVPTILGGEVAPDNLVLMDFNDGMLMFGDLTNQINRITKVHLH